MPEWVNDELITVYSPKNCPKKHWYNYFYTSNRLLSVSNPTCLFKTVIDCKQNLRYTWKGYILEACIRVTYHVKWIVNFMHAWTDQVWSAVLSRMC